MNDGEGALKSCNSYIECQFRETTPKSLSRRPFVTISRQAGAGGITVGRLLGAYLREHEASPCTCPWTVFDKNLVDAVLADHGLPERLAEHMPENASGEIRDTLDELFGVHPAEWTLVRKTSETILRLARTGNVILVGRGAGVVTRKLEGGFHVRLVGSLEERVAHVREYYGLDAKEARSFVVTEDEGRRRYLKKNFGREIDDPLLYDVTVNTDGMAYGDVARMLGAGAVSKFAREGVIGASPTASP